MMAGPYKTKTEFGKEVALFCVENDMKQKELAAIAEVKYSTLLDVCTGRSAGHVLIPKVRATMQKIREEQANQTA